MLKDSFIFCKSLPHFPLTSFIGRQQEIVEIKHLLNSSRLLTFWGLGGCGKSRLAFQVVAESAENFRLGMWWVELDTLVDVTQLLQKIARVIGISEPLDYPLLDLVIKAIADEEMLLILDNCDYLVTECAQLAEILLRACQRLRILVTSREALNIAGETIWHVAPLHIPDPQHLPPCTELMRYEAFELFMERALAVQPNFHLTEENALQVTRICCHLEGIPLAIELAAMRVKTLSIEQIAARMDDCCQFLISGYRTALPRHQSLRTTIDWSYNLLSEKEYCLLRRLSVFAGSFTLEAVEARCIGEGIEENELLLLLSRLIDKSLLLIEQQHTDVQYRLLRMVRQHICDLGAMKAAPLQEETLKTFQHNSIIGSSRGEIKLLDLEYASSSSAETTALAPIGRVIQRAANLSTSAVTHRERVLFQSVRSEIGLRSSEIRIFVLGPAQVYRGRQILTPADWKYAKAREMLFYLLCNPFKTKEQIGLALWPDVSASQLRSNFHSTLHHLRKALGGVEWIVFGDGLYTFNYTLDYWFDLETFEFYCAQAQKLQTESPAQAVQYLEKGIELYKGDFLESTSIGNWYVLRQKDLHKKYLDALFMLGQLFFAGDQYEQAANYYRLITIDDDLEESAHRELMRCYIRQGRRGQAVRHYRDLSETLKNELDAQPALETRELFERLCRGEEV